MAMKKIWSGLKTWKIFVDHGLVVQGKSCCHHQHQSRHTGHGPSGPATSHFRAGPIWGLARHWTPTEVRWGWDIRICVCPAEAQFAEVSPIILRNSIDRRLDSNPKKGAWQSWRGCNSQPVSSMVWSALLQVKLSPPNNRRIRWTWSYSCEVFKSSCLGSFRSWCSLLLLGHVSTFLNRRIWNLGFPS